MSSRTEATKQKMFDAMVELMGSRGYGDVSVDEIAERAGVAKGTIYYHYVSKAELMEALITDRLGPAVESFRAEAANNAEDPAGALRRVMRIELEFFCKQRSFARLILSEIWREDRGWRDAILRFREELLGALVGAIEAGRRSGEFRADVNPRFAAKAIFGMTATAALDYLNFHDHDSVDAVLDDAFELTKAMLRP